MGLFTTHVRVKVLSRTGLDSEGRTERRGLGGIMLIMIRSESLPAKLVALQVNVPFIWFVSIIRSRGCYSNL